MSKYILKYNQAARGLELTTMEGNTWVLDNLDTGEKILTDHIEFKVSVSTYEQTIPGKGFGMLISGDIEYRNYPNSDKQFIVIVPEK